MKMVRQTKATAREGRRLERKAAREVEPPKPRESRTSSVVEESSSRLDPMLGSLLWSWGHQHWLGINIRGLLGIRSLNIGTSRDP